MPRPFFKLAKCIDKARAQKIAEARAFLILKAWATHIFLGPREVDFLVRHVEITAK